MTQLSGLTSLLVVLLVGCAGPEPAPQPERTAAKAVVSEARDPTAGCTDWASCVLACPEGAILARDEQRRTIACYDGQTPHGPYTRWHSNGKKALSTLYVNGGKHGAVVAWYPNGAKMLSGFKRDDRANGPWRNWHPNGQLASESIWADDMWISGRCWGANGARCPLDHLCQEGPCP